MIGPVNLGYVETYNAKTEPLVYRGLSIHLGRRSPNEPALCGCPQGAIQANLYA
jgi:hypothetical protein